MGWESRDYAREESYGGGISFRDWEVWKKLIAANVLVFVLQTLISRPMTLEEYQQAYQLTDDQMIEEFERYDVRIPVEVEQFLPHISSIQIWLELDSDKVLKGQVWRLITGGFCHSREGISHVFFNMLLLYYCGRRLESRYGPREFAAFYFASLLASSLAYMALDVYTGDLRPAIGASGAVWGLMALYALLYPYEQFHLYLLFPVQVRFVALMYFLFDLHPVLLALGGESVMSGVGHAAHVGGAVFGYVYWRYDWRLMPWTNRITQVFANFGARPRSRSVATSSQGQEGPSILKMPSATNPGRTLESQMDEILEKIHREGRDSLTAEELEVLEQASRQLRGEKRRGH